jgi:hypothetical protein
LLLFKWLIIKKILKRIENGKSNIWSWMFLASSACF